VASLVRVRTLASQTRTHSPGKHAGSVGQKLDLFEVSGVGGVGGVQLLLLELLGNAPLSVYQGMSTAINIHV